MTERVTDPLTDPTSQPEMIAPRPLTAAERDSYEALHTRAVWFEAVERWCVIRGPKAIDAVNGLVTNDVAQLPVGGAQPAVALSPKGKVVCDLLVVRTAEDAVQVAVQAAYLPAWLDLARKYINPRLASVTDQSTAWVSWWCCGPEARQAVARLDGMASTQQVPAPTLSVMPSILVVVERPEADAVHEALEASGYTIASDAVRELARVEAGRPAMGVDMDEQTIPQEANLDALGAISFTKGCYTGQETVARVHFRGHVNRHLRGLMGAAPLPRHARVVDASGKEVGDVRSTVISPRRGPIAMAMLRRDVAIGSVVTVEGVPATVVALPFG